MALLDVTAAIRIAGEWHPPSSVPANITSHVTIMNPDIILKEVPSVSYICKCRNYYVLLAKDQRHTDSQKLKISNNYLLMELVDDNQ